MTRMLLLEIELDQIRPLREYWGAIGNPSVAAFLPHLEVGWGIKVSVHLLLSCRRGTIDV